MAAPKKKPGNYLKKPVSSNKKPAGKKLSWREARRQIKDLKKKNAVAEGYQPSKKSAAMSVGYAEPADAKTKTLKDKKPKSVADKTNWGLAFREFPAKMAKDIARINWIGKSQLGKAFILVLIFLIIFALIYAAADQLFLVIFRSINVI